MNQKSLYQTKQRKELLAYLEMTAGHHITVQAICAYFKEQGKPVGTATVYRYLEHMVEEGLINKYMIDAGSPACFEYTGGRAECRDAVCFHCKCEKCGRLIHLHCDELKGLQDHLLEHHQFRLNPLRTVLYGVCEDC